MVHTYWQQAAETASREELNKIQLERLRASVQRVYDHSRIYRERMDEAGLKPSDIRTLDDVRKLPFTMKKDLRDTYPFGMFCVPMEDVVRLHASSGTTGKQIVVGYTRHDLDVWSDCICRQFAAVGVDEHDFLQMSFGYGLFTGGFGVHGGAEKAGVTVVPMSTGNTERQLALMQDFGTTVLCCTPSYAMFLAESAEAAGIVDNLKLRVGIFGAEPWTEEMRRQIEEKMHLKAYDIYGLTEVMGPGVAFECSCQAGMHVNEDHFLVEVLDPDTLEPVPDGTPGELVFTTLSKEAFPVIRYRTRDIGTITHEKCACGRTFVRMSKPKGRTDDMLIIRGVNVFPSQIEFILTSLGLTSNYLIIVDRIGTLDKMTIKVEMSGDMFSDTVKGIEQNEKRIADRMQSALGIAAKIMLVEPKSLPRTDGKSKHVIDNRVFE